MPDKQPENKDAWETEPGYEKSNQAPGKELASSSAPGSWETEDSLFEQLMKAVSESINSMRMSAVEAAASILHGRLQEDENEEALGTIEIFPPGTAIAPKPVSVGDQIGGAPEVPVNYLIREFIDMVHTMRTEPPPGTPPMFKGIAYQYPSAIYSIGLYSGLCTLERNLKYRAEMRKATLYQPINDDDEKPAIIGQGPFTWKYLFPGPIPGRDKLTHVWCITRRLKDRLVRVVDDYPATNNQFVAQTCLTIVLANMKTYRSLDVAKARKEVTRLYKWYNSFRAPEPQPSA